MDANTVVSMGVGGLEKHLKSRIDGLVIEIISQAISQGKDQPVSERWLSAFVTKLGDILHVELTTWDGEFVCDIYKGELQPFRRDVPGTPHEHVWKTVDEHHDIKMCRCGARKMLNHLVSGEVIMSAIKCMEQGYEKIEVPEDTHLAYVNAIEAEGFSVRVHKQLHQTDFTTIYRV